MCWLLALYFKPSVLSLSVPALSLYSNVSKTCSISFAVGGSLFTVTLTSSISVGNSLAELALVEFQVAVHMRRSVL